jgi:hypothetical protein
MTIVIPGKTKKARMAAVDASKKELSHFVEANLDRMLYLYDRWQDEKNYEDFAEYAEQYKKLSDKNPNLVFKKATKKPMGFIAYYKPFNSNVQFYAGGRHYGWKPLV